MEHIGQKTVGHAEERSAHEGTHLPFCDWCPHCVSCRASDPAHRLTERAIANRRWCRAATHLVWKGRSRCYAVLEGRCRGSRIRNLGVESQPGDEPRAHRALGRRTAVGTGTGCVTRERPTGCPSASRCPLRLVETPCRKNRSRYVHRCRTPPRWSGAFRLEARVLSRTCASSDSLLSVLFNQDGDVGEELVISNLCA